MTKEKIVDIISEEVWVAHDSTVYGIEEAAEIIAKQIGDTDSMVTQLAMSIDAAHIRQDYEGDYCVFCLSDGISHYDDCIVPIAKKLLKENQEQHR